MTKANSLNLKNFFLNNLVKLYPIGESKIAPGTLASLITLFIGLYLILNLSIINFTLFIFFSIIISYFGIKNYL